jgi:hypothetical protein
MRADCYGKGLNYRRGDLLSCRQAHPARVPSASVIPLRGPLPGARMVTARTALSVTYRSGTFVCAYSGLRNGLPTLNAPLCISRSNASAWLPLLTVTYR